MEAGVERGARNHSLRHNEGAATCRWWCTTAPASRLRRCFYLLPHPRCRALCCYAHMPTAPTELACSHIKTKNRRHPLLCFFFYGSDEVPKKGAPGTAALRRRRAAICSGGPLPSRLLLPSVGAPTRVFRLRGQVLLPPPPPPPLPPPY